MTIDPNTPPFAAHFLLVQPGDDDPVRDRPNPEAYFAGRERLLMDAGWRFALGHPFDRSRDFGHATAFFSYLAKAGCADGPAAPEFNDLAWRRLDLPHDWVAELPIDPRGDMNHGYRAVGRNFPENSVAWYRRAFAIPKSDRGRRIVVEFDGVFRDARVFCNGFHLGDAASGYLGFEFDLTDILDYGGRNVLAVRVDATREEGWFYEGGGIYRHVWLRKTAPLHVARRGIFVSTRIRPDSAIATARATVVNDGDAEAAFSVEHAVVDADGTTVASARIPEVALAPGETRDLACDAAIPSPRLWSIESPHLYRLATELRAGDRVVDRCETPFGVRTLRFDPNEGFFLNGERVAVKGTNNHQDHAGVGTAVPDALAEFRVRRLKEMGSNAYRASHHPPAPELLDICDRLGMLVMDETRIMGSGPAALDQLREMVLRDRNHPCVFLWCLGNEEWAIEGNVRGTRIVRTMQNLVHRLDPTRPVVVASSSFWGRGTTVGVDVVGFNYFVHGSTDRFHAEFPDVPAIGSEECSKFGTRGVYVDDPAKCRLATDDTNYSEWGASSEAGWKHYAERPWAAGMFVWTGFDYRGEPAPFEWPATGSQFGILDACGFAKDHFHYYRAWWSDQPVLHVFPHWNWPDRVGAPIVVRCYSNCDEVELLANGESLGRKRMEPNGHLEWDARFAPGELLARGWKGGRLVSETKVETVGPPASVQLVHRRPTVAADGEDVAVVEVRIVDARGRVVPDAMNDVRFRIDGPGRILGVGNGDPASHEPDKHVDRIVPFNVDRWRVAEVSSLLAPRATADDVDDGAWSDPLHWQWRSRRAQALPAAYVLRGRVDLPAIPRDVVPTLFVRVLGDRQTVHVNGREVAVVLYSGGDAIDIDLDPHVLRAGTNIVAVAATARARGRHTLGGGFASLRLRTPAAPWRRTAFNGLAQVLVGSTRQPGEIVLSAWSAGLASATLRIESASAAARPSVAELR